MRRYDSIEQNYVFVIVFETTGRRIFHKP
jgi:hypothetical protein